MQPKLDEARRPEKETEPKVAASAVIPSRGWGVVLILATIWIGSFQLRRQRADLVAPSDQAVGYAVDINRATESDLLNLPEVGPSLVRSIVQYRDEHGNFTRPDDLLKVPGVGVQTLKQLKPYLQFPAPPPSTPDGPYATDDPVVTAQKSPPSSSDSVIAP